MSSVTVQHARDHLLKKNVRNLHIKLISVENCLSSPFFSVRTRMQSVSLYTLGYLPSLTSFIRWFSMRISSDNLQVIGWMRRNFDFRFLTLLLPSFPALFYQCFHIKYHHRNEWYIPSSAAALHTRGSTVLNENQINSQSKLNYVFRWHESHFLRVVVFLASFHSLFVSLVYFCFVFKSSEIVSLSVLLHISNEFVVFFYSFGAWRISIEDSFWYQLITRHTTIALTCDKTGSYNSEKTTTPAAAIRSEKI